MIGVGSDIFGSLRIPAACCGIFAHKPTAGVVPLDGLYPELNGKLSKFNTVGPMVRYVEDLLPVFKVMAGARDAARLKLDIAPDLKKVKLYHMPDDGEKYFSRFTAEMSTVVYKAVAHLEGIIGSKSQLVTLPEIPLASSVWWGTFTAARDPVLSVVLKNGQGRGYPLRELLLTTLGRSHHSLPSLKEVFRQNMFGNKEQLRVYAAKAKTSGDKLQRLLVDDGVLVFPANTAPAPYYYEGLVHKECFSNFTMAFNIIGLPVTFVPITMSEKEGVPIGVQVVGGRGSDRLCLAVAKELRKAFGGWKLPSASGRL